MIYSFNLKDMAITKNQKLKISFLNTLNNIFQKHPSIAIYLKSLDGKSTETYTHSVNVAFHLYDELQQDTKFEYTSDDIERWVGAALVHDTGKLTTDNEILHEDARLPEEVRKAHFPIMMRHSIDGYDLGKKKFDFPKEGIAAIIGHHINAECLENGPKNKFAGATQSRDEWKKEFEEGYIENLLTENLSWMTAKDVHALQTLSFFDDVEALRSTNRTYCQQHYWDKDDFETKDKLGRVPGRSVEGAIQENIVDRKRLSMDFDGVVYSQQFQRHFDELQRIDIPSDVRDLIMPLTKDYRVVIYKDKAHDIEKNPEVGKLFFKKRRNSQGIDVYVFASSFIENPIVLVPEEVAKSSTYLEQKDKDEFYEGLVKPNETYDSTKEDEKPYPCSIEDS